MAIQRKVWSWTLPTATSTMQVTPDDADSTDEDIIEPSSDASQPTSDKKFCDTQGTRNTETLTTIPIPAQSSDILPSVELPVPESESQQIATSEVIEENCVGGADEPFITPRFEEMVIPLGDPQSGDMPACDLQGHNLIRIAPGPSSIKADSSQVVQNTRPVVMDEEAPPTDHRGSELPFDAEVINTPPFKCPTKNKRKRSVDGSSPDMPITIDEGRADDTNISPSRSARSLRRKKTMTVRDFIDRDDTWMSLTFNYLLEIKEIFTRIRSVEKEQAEVASILVENQERISSLVHMAELKFKETEKYIKSCELKEEKTTKE